MAKSTSGIMHRFKDLGAILVVSSLLGAIGVTVGAPSASAGSCIPAPKANLTGCNFAGENLSGRNLTRANLTRVKFTGTNLGHAYLDGTRMVYVAASYANFTGAQMLTSAGNSNFSHATFTHANLRTANFSEANLSFAKLAPTTLTQAEFEDANLSHADLAGSNMFEGVLQGAKLVETNLTDVNLSNALLTDANLSKANLTGADMPSPTGPYKSRLAGVVWNDTTCPDGTNSNNDGHTCVHNLTPR